MKIAIIDDQIDIKYAIDKILKKEGHICYEFSGDENDLVECINILEIDLIILDMMLSNDKTGLDVINELKYANVNKPIIMISAYTTPSNMINISKAGVIDIIQKPFSSTEIIETINKYKPNNLKHGKTNEQESLTEDFIASFDTLKLITKNIAIASNMNDNVLIVGETGTGKDHIAKLIHKNSNKSEEEFVAINCSTIPENLFEKLMFGRTDNFIKSDKSEHLGHIQKVKEGTLYLDEIDELEPKSQSKLLRFLETKKFYPLGSTKEEEFKGKIISSINPKNIKKIRDDLYFRLSIVEINIPPLRQRQEDIEILAKHYIKIYAKQFNKQIDSFSENSLNYLKNLELEGNVRELQNIIYQVVSNCRESEIQIDDFKSKCDEEDNTELKSFCEKYIETKGIENAHDIFTKFEYEMLNTLYKKCSNISKLASYLQITRNTLKSKLKKYKII